MNIGYWYEGQLIWDEGSADTLTLSFQSPSERNANYIQWVYDKGYDI